MGRYVPKLFAVGFLTFVILIALGAVYGVLQSRQSYRNEAVSSISSSYAGAQRIVGPILVQPYTQLVQDTAVGSDGKQKVSTSLREASFIAFPQALSVTGTMTPSERYHGLYRV